VTLRTLVLRCVIALTAASARSEVRVGERGHGGASENECGCCRESGETTAHDGVPFDVDGEDTVIVRPQVIEGNSFDEIEW
jgi:hypothetical protein